MNTQPEALRLANELVALHGYPLSIKAAAELRRLYEANQAMLAALKLAEESLGSFVSDHGWSQSDMDNLDTVTAAIAKGEQQ
jgi:hypothetical protein